MLLRLLVISLASVAATWGQNAVTKWDSVATFTRIYQTLRDSYPMPELAGWNGQQLFQEFKPRVAAASREDAMWLMDEFVSRLNDYHTRLFWPEKSRLIGPPIRVDAVLEREARPEGFGIWGRRHPPAEMPELRGVKFAVVHAEENTGLRSGDEVVAIDGVPIRAAISRAWQHGVGSSVAAKLHDAASRLMHGEPGTEVWIDTLRGDVAGRIKIKRAPTEREAAVSDREVNGVPVIRISIWEGDRLVRDIDRLLEQYRERPALIFDVRGNGGGQSQLANDVIARFVTAPVIASISFHRGRDAMFERTVETIAPRGPWQYKGRVAVLSDEGCISTCEHFVSGMIEAGALVAGTPTSGACGYIRRNDLGDGVRLYVSETFPLHGGIPSPQVGIAPHVWVLPAIDDLRAGRDVTMSAAVEWVKSGAGLPVRMQPLSGGSDR
jgi:carboxyl-terminal processing protease